ncbi:MAG: hypothetical protein M1827_000108 [Pycnora praestabilis]|nr:MAG: hypothetical protein M1827_000108 [Pycnora praestabilis]
MRSFAERSNICVLGLNALLPKRLFSSVVQQPLTLYSQRLSRPRALHASPIPPFPRKREFFSSNAALKQQQQQQQVPQYNSDSHESQEPQRRKAARPPGAKTSLRRVAVEAQRSRDGTLSRKGPRSDAQKRTKRVTAYCVAEQFDLAKVVKILEAEGYQIDPLQTELYPQVVHIQILSEHSNTSTTSESTVSHLSEVGDVFIFPSGTVVAWSTPEQVTMDIVTKTLLPAAENAHLEQSETEDLEYLEDSKKENSSIRGDTIILGTKSQVLLDYERNEELPPHSEDPSMQRGQVDTILAKIAFSSGLARSTKLAVLESLLSNYFETTRSIPTMLSRGSRLPFTRSFILRKTGQLLSVRAQLNLYSELTDSLPDLFWDSRYELGLEGYYDQVGRALDVGVRIKVLNEKMDYAQEIASVLRERLSEKHGLVLEWMIIALIAVEVGFEIIRLWRERYERREKERRVNIDTP